MRTQAPKLSEIKELFKKPETDIVQEYAITIVTDAFIDSGLGEFGLHAFRTSTVRGHLRFWWRATRGASFRNAHALKAKERLIFGDTSLPSPFTLTVGNGENQRNWQRGQRPHAPYATFPYRELSNQRLRSHEMSEMEREAASQYGRTFKLRLRYRDACEYDDDPSAKPIIRLAAGEVEEEVTAALWAWINFGGIGARTRRGCGSLYCETFSPKINDANTPEQFRKWLSDKINVYGLPQLRSDECREWPILGVLSALSESVETMVIQIEARDVLEVWKETIQSYADFRQRRNTGIKEINGRPVRVPRRSHWPEPDALRRITGYFDGRHKTPYALADKEKLAFPRAQFGLPIITQFKDKEDPLKTELLPKDRTRLASPLILKPIAVNSRSGAEHPKGTGAASGNQNSAGIKAVGAIIRLIQPPLETLTLRYLRDKREPSIKTNEVWADRVRKTKFRLSQAVITSEHIYPTNIRHGRCPLIKGNRDAVAAFFQSKEVKLWKTHDSQLSLEQKDAKKGDVWTS